MLYKDSLLKAFPPERLKANIMKRKLLNFLLFLPLLASCSSISSSSKPIISSSSSEEVVNPLSVKDVASHVYEDVSLDIQNLNDEDYSLASNGEGIRIEGKKIIPFKANTNNEVTLTTSSGRVTTFKVNVENRAYTSKHKEAEEDEGWFSSVSVEPIASLTSSFANGMDISSVKQLYDNGQQFYNSDGVEESLFYILKEAGVNWIRLRLWNDPKDEYIEGGETKTFQYGGGNCDLDNVRWMAHEAKAAGLKILLNFHYSDFWADPTNQIIPKAWKDISSSDELAKKVQEYTTEVLNDLKENDALPNMVQIGNETYGGLFLHNPEGVSTSPTGGSPNYSKNKTVRNNGTEAKYDFTGSKDSNTNLRKYFKAAIDGINAVDSSILKMIHFVKGFLDPNTSIKFFNTFDDLDIDVYGLSAYCYYHWSNLSTLKSGLTTISKAFPTKKICIAETSYGFTYETDSWAENTFSKSGTAHPISGYDASIQGQAKIIRDATEVVSNLDNGFGLFYWEGAWTPTKFSGWADINSASSWANQALFSYNGKALGSLEVYKKMQPTT